MVNFRKGKTLVEIYGIDRAKEILEKNKSCKKSKWTIERKIEMSKRMSGKNNPMYNKRLIGKNNPFFGKKHSKETLELLEKNNYSKKRGKTKEEIYGKEKAEEIKNKSKESIKMTLKNKPKEFFEKKAERISKTKKRLIKEGKLNPLKGNTKPNKPEKIMINLIQKNNLPFNYVGNGKIWIGGFNPDFLSKNPKHIIEVFGDYWHNREDIKKRDKIRLKTYYELGYKTLIIWEHELNDESVILNKIIGFINL